MTEECIHLLMRTMGRVKYLGKVCWSRLKMLNIVNRTRSKFMIKGKVGLQSTQIQLQAQLQLPGLANRTFRFPHPSLSLYPRSGSH